MHHDFVCFAVGTVVDHLIDSRFRRWCSRQKHGGMLAPMLAAAGAFPAEKAAGAMSCFP